MPRTSFARATVLLAVVLALFAGAPPAATQTVDPLANCTNGTVHTMKYADGRLWIGGQFSYVGRPSGSAVAIARDSALPVPGFPHVNGYVRCIVEDGAGGWYLGGSFSRVGTASRFNLAHVTAGFTVDAFAPNPDGMVTALAYANGTLYAGGFFTHLGGASRYRIGAVATATGITTTWDPNPSGNVDDAYLPPYILSLEVAAGSVYVGGNFTTISGAARRCLAKLDPVTGAATAWTPNPDYAVYDFAVSGGTLYAGGGFLSMGGVARGHGAAFDLATGNQLAWNPQANNDVFAIHASGSTVWIAGGFTSAGGAARSRVAALDATSATAGAWNPGASWTCNALATRDGVVYVGGGFTGAGGGSVRHNVFAADSATGVLLSWAPVIGGSVRAIATAPTFVYLGGMIANVNGIYSPGVAAIDPTSGQAQAWSTGDLGPQGNVSALDVRDGRVYVTGSFTMCGTAYRPHDAAYDAGSGALLTWTKDLTSDGNAITTTPAAVYLASSGTQALLALNLASAERLPWSPAVQPESNLNLDDPIVTAVATDGGTLFLSGRFSGAGGALRTRFAALDASTALATAWNPGANGFARTLVPTNSAIYVAGEFTNIGGKLRMYAAALDPVTGVANNWNPDANGIVRALLPLGASVYLGGDFTTVRGGARSHLAAVNNTTGVLRSWNLSADGNVEALAYAGGRLWAGGAFREVGGEVTVGLAATTPDPLAAGEDGSLADALAAPNPFTSGVTVTFSLARAGDVGFDVLDLSGRRVRATARRYFEPGRHFWEWDGRDTGGRTTAPGVYFLRVTGPDQQVTRRVVRVR
ncbi:MAG: T9SS type A sorting domain-containing protein [Candidatus Eisenbacteria bacterium]